MGTVIGNYTFGLLTKDFFVHCNKVSHRCNVFTEVYTSHKKSVLEVNTFVKATTSLIQRIGFYKESTTNEKNFRTLKEKINTVRLTQCWFYSRKTSFTLFTNTEVKFIFIWNFLGSTVNPITLPYKYIYQSISFYQWVQMYIKLFHMWI